MRLSGLSIGVQVAPSRRLTLSPSASVHTTSVRPRGLAFSYRFNEPGISTAKNGLD